MTSAKLSHIQVNVRQESLPFYRGLFELLGWDPLFSDESGVAFNSSDDTSIWFMAGASTVESNYDGLGVNHIALAADSPDAVDRTVAYLEEQGIERLFETPRHRPDFSLNEDHTYYQVMFESPDGILFEHVYIGPKHVG